MARPQRKNVNYFPFYCEDGKKMFYLEETYGNDGFATFVKLLRELAKSDYHYLDLSKNTTTMFLSAKCKVSKEILESIINDLVELEKFDPMLWNENRVIWCGDFIASIQDAYNKRNNKCITYDGLVTLLIGLGVRKHGLGKSTSPINTQSKVKDIKVKDIKLNDSIENNTKIAEKLIFPFDSKDFMEIWELWIKYRTQSKKTINGDIAKQGQLKKIGELAKGNEQTAINIIMQSIENNWTGLFELKNTTQNGQNTTTRQQQERDEVMRILEQRKANR